MGSDCNVYANGPYVVLHGAMAGEVEVDVGAAGAVVDMLGGAMLGQRPRVTVKLGRGETRVVRVGAGE